MTIEELNIEELNSKLTQIEESIPKVKDLLNDILSCKSDTSKTILFAALKKYSSVISEFNLG